MKIYSRWDSEKIVFDGANLKGANLRHADLQGFDLKGAALKRANLKGANLRHADLRGADLQWGDLWYADLRDADLRDANLQWGNLRGADLRRSAPRRSALDFAVFPLSCCGTNICVDDRIIAQLCFHLTRQNTENCSEQTKADLLIIKKLTLTNLFCNYRDDVDKI